MAATRHGWQPIPGSALVLFITIIIWSNRFTSTEALPWTNTSIPISITSATNYNDKYALFAGTSTVTSSGITTTYYSVWSFDIANSHADPLIDKITSPQIYFVMSVASKALLVTNYYSVQLFNISTKAYHLTNKNLTDTGNLYASTSVGDLALFPGTSSVAIYNVSSGNWTQAPLSVSRYNMASTSVGTKAFFAGGQTGSAFSQYYFYYDIVDIYDSSTGNWSIQTLSVGRYYLSATSVRTKAIFAGGQMGGVLSDVVDIFDTSTNKWSTATLSKPRTMLTATSVGPKAFFAGGYPYSDVVDIYDDLTNIWSHAQLTVGRQNLVSTSVAGVAFFAGGLTSLTSSVGVGAIDIYVDPDLSHDVSGSFEINSITINVTNDVAIQDNFTAINSTINFLEPNLTISTGQHTKLNNTKVVIYPGGTITTTTLESINSSITILLKSGFNVTNLTIAHITVGNGSLPDVLLKNTDCDKTVQAQTKYNNGIFLAFGTSDCDVITPGGFPIYGVVLITVLVVIVLVVATIALLWFFKVKPGDWKPKW